MPDSLAIHQANDRIFDPHRQRMPCLQKTVQSVVLSCTPVVTVLVTPLPSRQEIGSVDAAASGCLHVANVNIDPFESVHPSL